MGAAIVGAIGQFLLEMNKVPIYLSIYHVFPTMSIFGKWTRPSAVKRSYP